MSSAALDATTPASRFRGLGRDRDGLRGFLVVLGLLPPLALGLIVLPTSLALAVALPFWLFVPWVWRRPVRGLYLILGATLLFEVFPLNFPDSLTDQVHFFLNLSNSTSQLQGVTVTPFEIVLLSVITIWIASSVGHGRSLELPTGPIVAAYTIYALVVVAAEIRGLAAGGTYLTSLWELRPQAYAMIAFVLASSLVRSRSDVVRVAAIFFSLVATKALVAVFRYLVTLHGNPSGLEAIMAHEESYFFALFLVGTVATAFWCRRRAVLICMIGLAPAVALALIANQRRAGVLALVAGAGTLVVLAARFDPINRRRLIIGGVLAVVVISLFLAVFWNQQSGLFGELVRPFHAFYQPDPRDYLSNGYRDAENLNLRLTMKSSPLFGVGFGLPMLYVYPMADISRQYPLWNIIPHNTVLWIGMRMGALGFAAFFGLLAMAVLQACRQATRRDVFLRGVAIFGVAAILMELVVGYTDLQLESYRNLIFFGILLGVIQRLPMLTDAPASPQHSLGAAAGAFPASRSVPLLRE